MGSEPTRCEAHFSPFGMLFPRRAAPASLRLAAGRWDRIGRSVANLGSTSTMPAGKVRADGLQVKHQPTTNRQASAGT